MIIKISGLHPDRIPATGFILMTCQDATAIASPSLNGDTVTFDLMNGTERDLELLRAAGYVVERVK